MTVLAMTGFPRDCLIRTTYYDGRPDENEAKELTRYWNGIEALPDTDLGWGTLRGGERGRKAPRQKGVDTLIAVDMLSGAAAGSYDLAVLAAGDEDFTPVVHEVRRYGVRILLAAHARSLSGELRRSADRVLELDPLSKGRLFPFLMVDKQYFGPLRRQRPDPEVESADSPGN